MQSLLSEKQLNILFNNSKDFVFLCKKTGGDYTYVYINDAATEIFQEDVIGRKLSEIRSVELNDLILKYYDSLIDKYRSIIPLEKVYIPVAKES